jgi:hypothetical protein
LDIVEGSAPSETKEETSKAHLSEEKVMAIHLDRLAPYWEPFWTSGFMKGSAGAVGE